MAKSGPPDPQEVENWLMSRGADRDCPICGHETWLPAPPGVTLALTAINPDMSVNRQKAFVVSTFVCENCAWVRLHAPAILQATQR
jgi:hypothetical protein